MDPTVKKFLRHLQCPWTVSDKEPPTLMSLAAYRESCKIFKEHNLLQGPHIGMYKFGSTAPFIRTDLPSKVWNYIPIGILSQTTLYRHQCHVTKKTYSWDVKDLRTIVLIDSEENLTYKRIDREEMRDTIDHIQFSPEHYNRPQRNAMAHGIKRRLVFDYQKYLRQNFSLACSDLKICFDRIVHSAASSAFQCLGIPLPAIISMPDTIQRILHTFRTE